MNKHGTSAGVVAMGALLLLPSIATAQSASIELVEARAMTAERAAPAGQPANTVERTPTNRGRSVTGEASAPNDGHRLGLREAARREEHAGVHRRSAARDETRMGRASATSSARCQSDIAEHHQQRRGASQRGPANAGSGKGANGG